MGRVRVWCVLRKWLAVAATAIGLAMAAAPATAQTLRMVSHADLKMLDPIWTTALSRATTAT